MLRVSSILYLQQVWSRPSSLVVVEAVKPIAPIIPASEDEEMEEETIQGEISLVVHSYFPPSSLTDIYILYRFGFDSY